MRFDLKSWSLFCLLGGLFSTAAAEPPTVELKRVYEGIQTERPITLVVPPDDSGRQFLVLQRGKVLILPLDEAATSAPLFLDISGRELEASKQSQFEEGLVGFAFHPKFAQNRRFYLYYTQQNPKRAVLSEMQASVSDASKADPATERVLLEVPLPYWNHHSGNLAFGPDGFLYITIGDGGGKPGGDPLRLAQNVFVFNGKVLRIDVDGRTGARAYGIPDDNPFAGKEAAREEIFAYGVRNPWGISFDADGTLWFADVGQDLWEEINLLEKGGNYGWSFREGMQRFMLRTDDPPEGTRFVEPIHVYDHTQGLSITGGFVYRGKAIPSLQGAYVYGDWVLGRIWALRYDKAARKLVSNDLLYTSPSEPAAGGKGKPSVLVKPNAFCEDAGGEILVLDWNGGLYRILPRRA